MTKIALLSGDQPRHFALADSLRSESLLTCHLVERKRSKFPQGNLGITETEILRNHFDRLCEVEKEFFPGFESIRGPTNIFSFGDISSVSVIESLRDLDVDLVLVFGTSILRPSVINAFGSKLVNLHLGLSPYYRGVATNFWPLYDRKPEFVGATFHRLSNIIDGGEILLQIRPQIELLDDCYTLGMRVILAIKLNIGSIIDSLLELGTNELPQQNLSRGKEFSRNDFNAEAIKVVYENFETGMIPEYLEEIYKRKEEVVLVNEFVGDWDA